MSSGGVEARLGGNSGGPGWFAPDAFCSPGQPAGCPALAIGDGFGYGNMGVGAAKGPGQFNFDVTLQKTTKITEKQTILFRAEFSNLFNHPQFNDPNQAFTLPVTPALPDVNAGPGVFGAITSTSVNPRVIQLGLKYIF